MTTTPCTSYHRFGEWERPDLSEPSTRTCLDCGHVHTFTYGKSRHQTITFEQAIENLELAIEESMPASDSARSYWAKQVFHRLGGVQDAIDQWRIGGDAS